MAFSTAFYVDKGKCEQKMQKQDEEPPPPSPPPSSPPVSTDFVRKHSQHTSLVGYKSQLQAALLSSEARLSRVATVRGYVNLTLRLLRAF